MTVARVLPNVTGLDKQFDYLVPQPLVASAHVGSIGLVLSLPDVRPVALDGAEEPEEPEGHQRSGRPLRRCVAMWSSPGCWRSAP